MMPTRKGSFRLFRLAGIDLYLHWSWFLIAVIMISYRRRDYSSAFWNVLEYVALFGIVLLHELGHALACRQVGGQANQIVLWPLGGVAYVAPPPRPGATLWSIAAGPLVNVALLAPLTLLWTSSLALGMTGAAPNAHSFIQALWVINLLLLLFNLLPVYPLDGGQILHSLLWFWLGRARSLMVATLVGFLGVAALGLFAWWSGSAWLGIVSAFIGLNCWRAFQHARMLAEADRAQRREGLACPACKTAPRIGAFWMCGKCLKRLDMFETQGICPHCHAGFTAAGCLECGSMPRLEDWRK